MHDVPSWLYDSMKYISSHHGTLLNTWSAPLMYNFNITILNSISKQMTIFFPNSLIIRITFLNKISFILPTILFNVPKFVAFSTLGLPLLQQVFSLQPNFPHTLHLILHHLLYKTFSTCQMVTTYFALFREELMNSNNCFTLPG